MSIVDVGCCGAYCGTCKVFNQKVCNGCKIGYENGNRDISKAKCKIKVCCINKKYNSCSDCNEYETCPNLNEFYSKGYKYSKYKQATNYIKQNGYEAFLKIAEAWKNAYGKY